MTKGECRRAMFFLPPRHTKSETVTVRYPVFRLEENPRLKVIVGAYNQTLANKFSRKSRRIAETRVNLSKDRAAVEDWETAEGGGFRAVGVGGGITGQGGDLILIDDPVKNREEADSLTYREKVWDWYRDDLYTRLEPGGSIIIIMTRWHEDDLAGRLLAEVEAGGEPWEVVNLPALAEEGDPLGREVGEALCPDRYDEAELIRTRRVLGDRSFNALYQQRPTAREGDFFKVANLQPVDALPAGLTFCRGWDLAATEGAGDYTAGVLMGKDAAGFYYVADVRRGRWGADSVERELMSAALTDGTTTRIRLPQDPGQAGKAQAGQLVRKLAGYPAQAAPVSGDKETRAFSLAAQVNAGNVRILRAPWNREFIEELRSFPQGAHDDQVDAAADAFNVLTEQNKRVLYA